MFFVLSQNKAITPYRPSRTMAAVPDLKDSASTPTIDQDSEHDRNFDIILRSIADKTKKQAPRSTPNSEKKIEGYKDPQETSPTFAEDIMSKPVITLPSTRSVMEAIQLMHDKNIRHIPIVEKNARLIGIVSERDLIRQKRTHLNEFLGRQVITSGRHATIAQLSGIMVHERLGCLPVVEEHGELIGIVTRTDILNALIRRGSLDLWT